MFLNFVFIELQIFKSSGQIVFKKDNIYNGWLGGLLSCCWT